MSDFPKLLWLPDGTEITVSDQDEQDRQVAAGARLSVDAHAAAALERDPVGEAVDADVAEAEAAPKKKRGKK